MNRPTAQLNTSSHVRHGLPFFICKEVETTFAKNDRHQPTPTTPNTKFKNSLAPDGRSYVVQAAGHIRKVTAVIRKQTNTPTSLTTAPHSIKGRPSKRPHPPYPNQGPNASVQHLHNLLLLLSLSPLCRVFIHIFLTQTMSLGNTVFQLFCHYYLWCLYR